MLLFRGCRGPAEFKHGSLFGPRCYSTQTQSEKTRGSDGAQALHINASSAADLTNTGNGGGMMEWRAFTEYVYWL